jgi:putative two-component system response regulator
MADANPSSNILVVDDDPANLRLLAKILKHGDFIPRPVTNGRLAIEAAVADPPDLILLDLEMPQMSGIEVCKWFKQDQRLKDIPIIFISGRQEIENKVKAFHAGGADYISKPFQEQEVLERIRTHLRMRQLNLTLTTHNVHLEQLISEQREEVAASQLATIFALAKLAETRDNDTGHHIERVQIFSKVLGEQLHKMKLHPKQRHPAFIDNLYQTAALHDIGKVGIPDAILLKPGKLSEDEFITMKKHCELGASTLVAVQKQFPDNHFLRMGVEVARSHHEKWDGSGYPDGLEGQRIPLSARIVALADFYDAMTSERCYRKAFDHEYTRRMIQEGSGSHFDPDIAGAFVSNEDRFRKIRKSFPDH